MRDPMRIERTLLVVGNYWKQHPDLRLAQIIGNCTTGDPYHLEDDELVRRILKASNQASEPERADG